MTPSWAARERPWVVTVVLLAAAAFAAVFAVLLFDKGAVPHPFPSYVEGEPAYEVVRYSGPWIAGGIALGGVAALLLVAAIKRLLRRGGPAASPVSTDTSRPVLPSYPLPGLPGD